MSRCSIGELGLALRLRLGLGLGLIALSFACARSGPGAPAADPSASDTTLSEVEQLCAHSYELLIVPTGTGSPAVREDFLASCALNSEQRRAELGDAVWSERSACLLAAHDSDELGLCDGRQPRARPEPSEVSASDLVAVCDHLVGLMTKELGPSVGVGAEEFDKFRDKCVEDAAEERRKDPVDFDRVAGCILRAQTIEAMSACEEQGG